MAYIVSILVYGLPIVIAILVYVRRRMQREASAASALEQARAAGLAAEPTSLHPVIDPNVCIGSGSCAKACPEQALGIVDGKARLVNPAVCIGQGACMSACPVEAIKLVFGTEKRGVDIPNVDPSCESSCSINA